MMMFLISIMGLLSFV